MPDLAVVPPDGASITVPVVEAAPGRYQAEFVPSVPGKHRFVASRGSDTAMAVSNLTYPARLDWAHPDLGTLQLASATGGRVFAPGTPYETIPSNRWVGQSVWPLWAGLVLLLFMLELSARYTQFFSGIAHFVMARAPRNTPTSTGSPHVSGYDQT
jgi:hypothetical protein